MNSSWHSGNSLTGEPSVAIEHRNGALWSIALLIGLCAMGCAAPDATTRSAQAEPLQEFTEHFLVIQDTGDGTATHRWILKNDFERQTWFAKGEHPGAVNPHITLASKRTRDCNQEHHECYRRCKRRKPPYPYEYKRPSHSTYCRETCQEAYMECLKATGQYPVEFSQTDEAIDWMKRHRKEILVGTVIVAAGVVFVVVSAGAGALVLAPLALM